MPLMLKAAPLARFFIFGDGGLKPNLERRARSLGVRDRVVFAGYRPDVTRYYAAFDVSVLTSLSEGLSITLLESMQHGLPVVVTDVGGNGEVVVQNLTGYLVPPRAVEPFAERVVHLLTNPTLRQQMGEAARRVVAERFNPDGVAREYLQIYADLLALTLSRG